MKNKWEIIYECDDEEDNPTCWALEINHEKHGKYVGMHAHNNQQLAFANTIEATARGVSYLDATMMSIGRGAGNCAMELLISFLKNPKYNIFPVMKFIEEHMIPLKEAGLVVGRYCSPAVFDPLVCYGHYRCCPHQAPYLPQLFGRLVSGTGR